MNKKQILFFVLGGFFITNALVAELVGGKIFAVDMPDFLPPLLSLLGIEQSQFHVSVGLLPWPIVFLATDLVNEFFGRKGVRFYTFVTVGLILYMFLVITLGRFLEATDFSPVDNQEFDAVFGMGQWIIIGSVTAFAISQLLDVLVFTSFRRRTGSRHLWLRATGSTIVSQLMDTFIIGGVAFYLPGFFTFEQYMKVSIVSYIFKVVVAVLLTPLCYLGHYFIELYLGKEEAQAMAEEAARQNLELKV